LSLSIR